MFGTCYNPKASALSAASFALPLTNPREMDGFYGDSAFDGGSTPIILTATPVV